MGVLNANSTGALLIEGSRFVFVGGFMDYTLDDNKKTVGYLVIGRNEEGQCYLACKDGSFTYFNEPMLGANKYSTFDDACDRVAQLIKSRVHPNWTFGLRRYTMTEVYKMEYLD